MLRFMLLIRIPDSHFAIPWRINTVKEFEIGIQSCMTLFPTPIQFSAMPLSIHMPDQQPKLIATGLIALIFLCLSGDLRAYEYSYPFEISADSALLLHANTGQIVYSKNADDRFQPASLLKIMTLYQVFDAIKQDGVKLNQEILISKQAADKKGSTMYLRAGEKVTVEELVKGLAIVSGNDAAMAIAEGLFGGELALVEKMNKKLLALNMPDSHFKTVDGWPAPDQYTSAHDIALLSQTFIEEHPEALQYHKLKEFSHADIVLHNRNGLILRDPAIDGLKTGYVEEAGYHLVASAEKEGQRYIAVVMGAKDIETREKEVLQLLDFAFNNLITVQLFSKDEILTHLAIVDGVKNEVGLKSSATGEIIIPADLEEFVSYELDTPGQQNAPVERDQPLGAAVISLRDEELQRILLLASEAIKQVTPEQQITASKTAFVAKYKYLFLSVFILLCVMGLLFWIVSRYRRRSIKQHPNGSDRLRQRYDNI
jgi:D-alanyl-D-alanine carboxypeptidase (penicillin-binding protein 5/6)